MNHPHISQTLSAIRQPWLGGARGGRYAAQIEQALRTRNRRSIDRALVLGHYLIHSQSNKRKRAAIRAVMLAELTVGGRRLNERDLIHQKLQRRSRAQLVADLRIAMGIMWDNGKRHAWAPRCFTDPGGSAGRALQRQQNWVGKSLPRFRFVIHSLLGGDRFDGSLKILKSPAKTLAGWDAISCSLISNNKPHPYGDFGLILRVSERNVLTVAPADQQFRNHIGTRFGRTDAEKTGGLKNKGLLVGHVADKNAELGGLRTPAEVLAQQAVSQKNMTTVYHSEVVVVGRSGANFGAGVTQPIGVPAVFRRVTVDGQTYRSKYRRAMTRDEIKRFEDAVRLLGVPLLYIPDHVRH